MLMVVLVGDGALFSLEIVEDQMSDALRLGLEIGFKDLVLRGFYKGIIL